MPRKDSITLSPKHGVNPAIPLCFYCNEPKNEVILAGRLKGDVEAPRAAVWNREPCDTCQGYMRQGVILISVRDGEEGDNPYRTGGWVVVTEDSIRRALTPASLVTHVLAARLAFVPDTAWDRLGLPRGPVETGDAAS